MTDVRKVHTEKKETKNLHKI